MSVPPAAHPWFICNKYSDLVCFAYMAVLVDTHKVYSKLVAAGFEKTKADAIVETFSMAEEGVATKADVAMLKSEFDLLRRDMDISKRVRSRFGSSAQRSSV